MLKKILNSALFKNISYLAGAEIITKLIAFFVVMHVARVLGPANYGKVGFAGAFCTYFVLIVNMGLDVIGTRDVARNKDNAPAALTNIITLRTLLFVVSYGLLLLTTFIFPKDPVTDMVLWVYGFQMILTPTNYEWYFVGIENFRTIGISRVAYAVVYAALVFLLIHQQDQVVEFTALQIFTNLIPLFIFLPALMREMSVKHINIGLWPGYMKTGSLLTVSFFMGALYNHMDKVMLGYWYPDEYVGWYEAAYKILALALVPSILLWNVFMPRISRNSKTDLWRYALLMSLLGTGMTLFVLLFNEWIIAFVFGADFGNAALPLAILSGTIILSHINRVVVAPLQLWGKEKIFFGIMAFGALVNAGLNLMLIPRYDIIGAAWATVIADIAVSISAVPFFLKFSRQQQEIPQPAQPEVSS